MWPALAQTEGAGSPWPGAGSKVVVFGVERVLIYVLLMSCMYWGWLRSCSSQPVIHLYTSCSYTFYGITVMTREIRVRLESRQRQAGAWPESRAPPGASLQSRAGVRAWRHVDRHETHRECAR